MNKDKAIDLLEKWITEDDPDWNPTAYKQEFKPKFDYVSLEDFMIVKRRYEGFMHAFEGAVEQIGLHKSRIEELEAENKRLIKICEPYVTEADGTDLIPNYARIANMLERLQQELAIGVNVIRDGEDEEKRLREEIEKLKSDHAHQWDGDHGHQQGQG